MAGIAKYFSASFDSIGKREAFTFHHSNGSVPLSTANACMYALNSASFTMVFQNVQQHTAIMNKQLFWFLFFCFIFNYFSIFLNFCFFNFLTQKTSGEGC